MRPLTIEVNGVGNSPPVPLDVYQTPFNISLFVEVVAGAIDATVQYTGDNVFDPSVVPQWFDHAELQNETAAATGTIISPVTAVRLANNDTGTARLRIVQAGAV